MAKVGKFLGLVSPVLAIGVVALMLFGTTYGYEAGGCRSSHAHQPSNSECYYESGTISALRVALFQSDSTLFSWSVFIVAVCLIAAVGGSRGEDRPHLGLRHRSLVPGGSGDDVADRPLYLPARGRALCFCDSANRSPLRVENNRRVKALPAGSTALAEFSAAANRPIKPLSAV